MASAREHLACVLWLATLVSVSTAVLSPQEPSITVHPRGTDAPACGSIHEPCRSITYAVAIAPPYADVFVHNGTYACGVHARKPVALVALGSGVYLRCGGVRRGVWFDGVPAHIDGFHIEDGYGEGAGGVLSTQFSESTAQDSLIARCTFTGCVGVPSPHFEGVAGAVLLLYSHLRGLRPYTLQHSRFEGNYARGDDKPSGAAAVRTRTPIGSAAGPPEHCHTIAVAGSEGDGESVSKYAKVYYNLGPRFQRAGYDTFNTLGSIPTKPTDEVHWIAFCPTSMLYGFYTTKGGVVPSETDACSCEVCGTAAMAKTPLTAYEWWMLQPGSRAFLQPQCQDMAMSCDHFYATNLPPWQAERQVLFSRVRDLDRANRPTFFATHSGQPQWVFYCDSLREWVLADELPADDEPDCSRGVASAATLAHHPLLADGWRAWNTVTEQWHPVPPKRNGGLHFVCHEPAAPQCSAVQLSNIPLEQSVVFVHTPVERTNGWHEVVGSRGLFRSTTSPSMFISYCGKFNEWMVHNVNPFTDPDDVLDCVRRHASLPTHVREPTDVSSWALGHGGVWELSTADAVCVQGCRSLLLQRHPRGSPSSSTTLTDCEFCGLYEATGTHRGNTVFRLRDPVDPGQWLPYAIARADSGRWVVTNDDVSDLAEAEGDPLQEIGGLVFGGTQDDPLLSPRWSEGDGGLEYALLCSVPMNCSMVSIEHEDFPGATGIYIRTALHAFGRPVYRTRDGATLQYNATAHRWVATPTGAGRGILATERTVSLVPTSACTWNHRVDGNDQRSFSKLAMAATVRCVGKHASRLPQVSTSTIKSAGDNVTECGFYGNSALGDVFDKTPVAGALMLSYGTSHLGVMTRGAIRNVSFQGNEGVSHHRGVRADGAGALLVDHPTWMRNLLSVYDASFADNVGDVGGAVQMEGSIATFQRTTFVHNTATQSGGALAGGASYLNVSHSYLAHNDARIAGGFFHMAPGSRLWVTRSELVNGSAGLSGSMVKSRGYVKLHSSKAERMQGMTFTGSVLLLMESQLHCSFGTAMTFIGGFGCTHEAGGNAGMSTPHPVLPLDPYEAYWVWMANASSLLAQCMLSLTMALFALQYWMAHRLASMMPSARQIQASRWKAKEQLKEQQNGRHS